MLWSNNGVQNEPDFRGDINGSCSALPLAASPSMHLHYSTFCRRHLSGVLLCQLAAVCLVIVGCKLWLIGSYGSPLPFLDQWKGEGAEVLRPWMEGELRPADLFAPFNEHRIVPTRVLALGLFEANARQWDVQVQMVAGAMLHGACAFILGAVLVARCGTARKWPILGALLVLFCLPFDWQNTLWGFQSQFYFLILFTLLAFWGLAGHEARTRSWWWGVVGGLLACLSMGSGGCAGVALAAWVGLRLVLHPPARRERGNWITLGVSLAFGILGLALYTPPQAAPLTAIHVQSASAFLRGLGIHLSWPNSASPLLAFLAFVPFVVLLGVRLRDLWRGRDDAWPAEKFLFPLGFWVLLQAAALAYSRNHAIASVISRYMDLLALGALVNFCCLLRLIQLAASAISRRVTTACAVVWCGLAIAGLVPLVQRNLRLDLPSLNKIHRLQAAAVRQFLTTDQVADLGGKPVFGLPPEDLDLLAELLRDPVIQNALPTGLGIRRPPVPPGLLSAASQTAIDRSGLFLGCGLFILLLCAIRGWVGDRRSKARRTDHLLKAATVSSINEPGSLRAGATT
jgi:hypothetical protein